MQPSIIQASIAVLLAAVLAVLAIIWVAPAVGVKNSACERYPASANCR